jgi:hypothetical protein
LLYLFTNDSHLLDIKNAGDNKKSTAAGASQVVLSSSMPDQCLLLANNCNLTNFILEKIWTIFFLGTILSKFAVFVWKNSPMFKPHKILEK